MENTYDVSVIVTSYQAEKSIMSAILSILEVDTPNKIEIIVVDDCSTDTTIEKVSTLMRQYHNIKLIQMPVNTGGPSKPRNEGIRRASGKYITFLDDDDTLDAGRLLAMVREADEEEADFAKGYLICIEGSKSYIANRLMNIPKDKTDIIQNIVAYQSMTQDFIVRKDLIEQNELSYREDIKIGEDTIFITSILKKARHPIYIDEYFLKYNKTPIDMNNVSATQNWGDQEISHQIIAWQIAEENLQEIGLSYYKIRLCAGIRNVLLGLVRYSNGISIKTFSLLSAFMKKTKSYTYMAINLINRYQELYDVILEGNYEKYCQVVKRRLLIAGYDLKFIMPLVKYLKKDYNIKIDEWTGHDSHNEKQSKKMLEWADIIWCEWLLGNAVYYAKLKNKTQRLVIRAHRFELDRDFGFKVQWEQVDMIFTVGYYYLEQFIEKFHIPRNKMRLLSNYVEEQIYTAHKNSNYQYHIGMVGIAPRRKGYLRGLEILKRLVEKNEQYKLYVMGKNYQDIPWIKNNPVEAEYYKQCESYIKAHHLENHIVYGGFVEREKLYEDLGFVLSLSDSKAPESFHLAPAEATCSGCLGMVLRWPGVEFIYPDDAIYESMDEMIETIYKASRDETYFRAKVEKLRQYILKNYSMEQFLKVLGKYLVQIRMMG